MTTTTILSDNGVSSGTAGIKTTGGNDGTLALQTTTSGGTATTAVTIDTSQNVGIGTSSPGYKLDVIDTARINASANGNDAVLYLRSGATTGTLQQILFQMAGSAGDVRIVGSNETNSLRFVTASTERARIDSSGNLLVGTTSTNASGAPLSLNRGGVNWGVGPNSGGSFIIYNASGTGQYMTNGGTTWNSSSDERLKTALTPFENAAQKICTLRTGTGRYLTDDETVSRSFLIAQDVQKVLPEAVNVQSDEQGTLGLAYTDVIPLLVAAIQELKAEIDELKGAQA